MGYTEKDAQSSLCSDKMDSEICASYKGSGMCKTGEKVTRDSKELPWPILSLQDGTSRIYINRLVTCRVCKGCV